MKMDQREKCSDLNLSGNKMGKALKLIGIGEEFLSRTLVAQEIVLRTNKRNHSKFKSLYTTKTPLDLLPSIMVHGCKRMTEI